MWIYQHIDWTNFQWDYSRLASKLSDIRYKQGVLLGKMQSLGFDVRQEATLNTLTNDVVKSSLIEGENLDTQEVRSSIARRLGIETGGLVPSSRDVDGIVEIMLDATQNFTQPLTQERLFDWHACIFPTGRSGMHRITVADWRDDKNGAMQVISGAIGHENIHFQAPSADIVQAEMDSFLKWIEDDIQIDLVLKAGIAHLWFITIHPFDDGNGRIARTITDMVLARAENMSDRFYSLSTQIEIDKKEYYLQLESQQKSNSDITNWLSWFLDSVSQSIDSADVLLSQIFYRTKVWDIVNQHIINERQKLIITRMLENNFEGFMNTSKYAKLAKCSNDSALRDIQSLKNSGIFIQNEGRGRSTSYRLLDNC